MGDAVFIGEFHICQIRMGQPLECTILTCLSVPVVMPVGLWGKFQEQFLTALIFNDTASRIDYFVLDTAEPESYNFIRRQDDLFAVLQNQGELFQSPKVQIQSPLSS